MDEKLDLKAIERKAFISMYQDGLWDIYYGLIVMAMSIFIFRPSTGYSPINIVLTVISFMVAYALFFAGKRFLTLPRMGQVKFGEHRKRRNKTLAVILGILVLLQIGLVGLTSCGMVNPALKAIQKNLFQNSIPELALVAAMGSLIVGISMVLIVHFTDFKRGYYIAILMSLTVFMMIFLNQPWIGIAIGSIILIPGVVLLVRFLKTHPLPKQGAHE